MTWTSGASKKNKSLFLWWILTIICISNNWFRSWFRSWSYFFPSYFAKKPKNELEFLYSRTHLIKNILFAIVTLWALIKAPWTWHQLIFLKITTVASFLLKSFTSFWEGMGEKYKKTLLLRFLRKQGRNWCSTGDSLSSTHARQRNGLGFQNHFYFILI